MASHTIGKSSRDHNMTSRMADDFLGRRRIKLYYRTGNLKGRSASSCKGPGKLLTVTGKKEETDKCHSSSRNRQLDEDRQLDMN
uniref:Uncharacterized protein n=1 Tax=Romanomermis culicivorax TaxID=13658 RepID=A0A915IR43_ROMCU